jgi:maleylacetate reductase
MSEADVDVAADLATTEPYWNPRPVTRESIRTLLLHAFDGAPPSA